MVKEPFDPECFVDTQFKTFNIQDLKDHQQTILNVFHQFQNQNGEADLDHE